MTIESCAIKTDKRYQRQQDIIDLSRLEILDILIVGTGAIGRQAALQLAAMGVPTLTIIDFDTVEDVNLASQGFLEEDLGRPKVEAVRDMMVRINSTINVTAVNREFNPTEDTADIVFCCVDKMDVREQIWETIGKHADLFIDARMSAEVMRIIATFDDDSKEHYPETLFAQEESQTGACTAKTTIYCANAAGAIMTSVLTKWLRKTPIDKDISFNLLTMELGIN